MNLQPLYDVQERLEHAAVAGTSLLGEDFRLKRAMENLAPLAAASPVFGKISTALEGLLSMPLEGRGGRLLDTLALVDAVVYTQGKTGCPGPLEPLPSGVGVCRNLSYGQLHPLLDALTGTGGGRAAIIEEIWKAHPEHFSDYRVLPALVKGLGDSYADLADQNQQRLIQLGSVSVSLLKEGFDPSGGKEMARRVAVLDAVAGAAENDFYRAQLPQAKKEVHAALIYALRHDTGNLPFLLELLQTERKGEGRSRIWRILAQMEGPEVEEALQSLVKQDWAQAVEVLSYSNSPLACRLTAQLFEAELEPYEAEPDRPVFEEMKSRLEALTTALDWKAGPEVCRLYRRAAAAAPSLTCLTTKNGKRETMRFPHTLAPQKEVIFQQLMPLVLTDTLMGSPDTELCRLALELYEQYGADYLAPALTAQLWRLDSKESYQWAEQQVVTSGLLGHSIRSETMNVLQIVLGRLYWNTQKQSYLYSRPRNTLDKQVAWIYTLVPTLDPQWFTLMIQCKGGLDEILIHLLHHREPIPELSGQVRNYLYQMAMRCSEFNHVLNIITILKEQNWSDWDNFPLTYLQKNARSFYHWQIFHLIDTMPIPPLKKVEQLQEIGGQIWDKKIKIRGGSWPSGDVLNQIAVWEQQAQLEGENGNV